jgi:hypothetical protein
VRRTLEQHRLLKANKRARVLRKAIREVLSLDWSYGNHGPSGAFQELAKALEDERKLK